MAKIISFYNHPLVMDKQEADYNSTKCTLINSDTNLPFYCRYGNECKTCEVPKYFKEARVGLTKLILTGKP
ncbi:MAG: hypothetical protein ABIF18_02800 [archaeon]